MNRLNIARPKLYPYTHPHRSIQVFFVSLLVSLFLISSAQAECTGYATSTRVYSGNCSTWLELSNKIADPTKINTSTNIVFLDTNFTNNASNRFYMNSSNNNSLRINSSKIGNELNYIENFGIMDIVDSTITSWNTSNNTPDIQQQSDAIHNPQAYIYSSGSISQLNISNSYFEGLGYSTAAGANAYVGGISWYNGATGYARNSTFLNVLRLISHTNAVVEISNNTILINSSLQVDSSGVALYAVKNNTVIGNYINLTPTNAYGVLTWTGTNTGNIIKNNSIVTSGSTATGIRIFQTSGDYLENNTVAVSGTGTTALQLDTGSRNITIEGGNYTATGISGYGIGLWSTSLAIYDQVFNITISNVSASGNTNDIRLTGSHRNSSFVNVTLDHNKTFFTDTISNYNKSFNGIYVNTNFSEITTLTRHNFTNWNQSNLKFNDSTFANNQIATYSVSGLASSSPYYVYSKSNGIKTYIGNYNSSSSGELDSFSATLTNMTEIEVNNYQYIPPVITKWCNDITGCNSHTGIIEIDSFLNFNVTANQPLNTIDFAVDGIVEQSSSSNTFSRSFPTVGYYNVTMTVYNGNGSSIEYMVMTVKRTANYTYTFGSSALGCDWDTNTSVIVIKENTTENFGRCYLTQGLFKDDMTDNSILTGYNLTYVGNATYTVSGGYINYTSVGVGWVIDGTDEGGSQLRLNTSSITPFWQLTWDQISNDVSAVGIQYEHGVGAIASDKTMINWGYILDSSLAATTQTVYQGSEISTNSGGAYTNAQLKNFRIRYNDTKFFTYQNETFIAKATTTSNISGISIIGGKIAGQPWADWSKIGNIWVRPINLTNNIETNGNATFIVNFGYEKKGSFVDINLTGIDTENQFDLYSSANNITYVLEQSNISSGRYSLTASAKNETQYIRLATRSNQTFAASVINITVGDEGNFTPQIGISDSGANQGEDTNSYINLTNFNDFGVADIKLYYNSSVVTVNSASCNFGGCSLTTNIDNANGTSTFLIIDTDIPGNNSPLTLVTVSLHAVGSATTSSLGMVIPTFTDSNGNPPASFNIANGTFTAGTPISPTPLPTSSLNSYVTSTCASTLNWGIVGASFISVLLIVVGGGLAFGFMSGTLKMDTFPIQEFVFAIVAVVVIGSIGVAIIQPIITVIGCP